MKQNSMLAMILAGGRGSRLHELTNKVAVSLLKALSIQLSVRLRVCHLCLISHGKGGNGNYR